MGNFNLYYSHFYFKPFFLSYNKDKQDVLRVLTIFGSTTFFGIPIVAAIYGPTGVMYSSIFNIGYRIFLYSYGYIKMSGLKMELKNWIGFQEVLSSPYPYAHLY